jgi:hypothetical protein
MEHCQAGVTRRHTFSPLLSKAELLMSTQAMRVRTPPTSLTLLLLGSLALPCCATSTSSTGASSSPSEVALDYYPLLAGWGWAYEIEREGTKVLALYSVIERSADLAIVKNVDDRIEYALRPDGIVRRDGMLSENYVLKNPVRVGTTWSVAGGDAKVVAVGQTVTLPSGTYRDCVVVEETRHDPDRVTRTTYSRGAGPIEIEMRVFNATKMAFEVTAQARILSVTRPEETP